MIGDKSSVKAPCIIMCKYDCVESVSIRSNCSSPYTQMDLIQRLCVVFGHSY